MAGFYGSLCLTDIPKELITVGKNGKKYLNIEIGERRQPSQQAAAPAAPQQAFNQPNDDGDLPF